MRIFKRFIALSMTAVICASSVSSISEAKVAKLYTNAFIDTYGDGEVAGCTEFYKKFTYRTGKVTTIKITLNNKTLTKNNKVDSKVTKIGVQIPKFGDYYTARRAKVNATYVNGTDKGSLGVSKSTIDSRALYLFAKKVNGKYTEVFNIDNSKDFVVTIKIKPLDR